jgi:hypothetical protein
MKQCARLKPNDRGLEGAAIPERISACINAGRVQGVSTNVLLSATPNQRQPDIGRCYAGLSGHFDEQRLAGSASAHAQPNWYQLTHALSPPNQQL